MRKSILEVRALSKSYELPGGALWRRKRNPVLRDFSMKLSEGEILGIAGPSGAARKASPSSLDPTRSRTAPTRQRTQRQMVTCDGDAGGLKALLEFPIRDWRM